MDTKRFIWLDIINDICSDGLRNSDLIVKKICSFLRQNFSSKFRNTGKVIPFIFDGANMSMQKGAASIFVNCQQQLVNSENKIPFS